MKSFTKYLLFFFFIVLNSKIFANEIDEKIKNYILKNPEVIIQSLQSFEKKKEEEKKIENSKNIDSFKNKIFDSESLYEGEKLSNKVIVEFFDYNCSYCKRAHLDLKKILKKYDDVKVIYKNFPILSDNSLELAKYAVAISEIDQTKFIKFHNFILTNKGQINKDVLSNLMDDLGIDQDNIQKRITNEEISLKLKNDYDLANNLGLRGTPAFIIGNEIIFGYIGYEEILSKLDQQ